MKTKTRVQMRTAAPIDFALQDAGLQIFCLQWTSCLPGANKLNAVEPNSLNFFNVKLIAVEPKGFRRTNLACFHWEQIRLGQCKQLQILPTAMCGPRWEQLGESFDKPLRTAEKSSMRQHWQIGQDSVGEKGQELSAEITSQADTFERWDFYMTYISGKESSEIKFQRTNYWWMPKY